jgi:3-phenylpropionate/trans-cinnamate dioxygenase ferredoxin subunit
MTDWVTIAATEDLPEGAMLGVEVDGADVLVVNLGDRYVAIGAECTHAGCILSEDGELDAQHGAVTCLCHGSVFSLDTGEAVGPPAKQPVPVYQVRVEGNELQVAPIGGC